MNPLDKELQDLENELRGMRPSQFPSELNEQATVQLFGANLAQHKPTELSNKQLDSLEDIMIENELRNMPPITLDKSFLDQLELIPTEVSLSEFQPSSLSTELIDKVAYKLENLDSAEEKVIALPTSKKSNSKNWKWYTSAAAVACIGIFCGLSFTQQNNPTYAENKATDSFLPISSDNLQNVSTESTLIQAENKGIISTSTIGNAPYRAVRIIEMETQTLKSASGNIIQVQRPVEKIIRIPVEAD